MLATSRQDYRDAAAAIGVEFFPDADDFCEEHPDVVVLATSILSPEAVCGPAGAAAAAQHALCGRAVVKEFPKRLLLALLPAEVCMLQLCTHISHSQEVTNDISCSNSLHVWLLPLCIPEWARTDPRGLTKCAHAEMFALPAFVNAWVSADLQSQPRCRQQSNLILALQVDILCTHPMFGPDSGRGSWEPNLMYERVRIGHGEGRRRRADLFLQVS